MGSLMRDVAIVAGMALVGCGCCSTDSDDSTAPNASAMAVADLDRDADDTTVTTDLFASVASCDIYHRGAVLDLGSPAAHGRLGYALDPSATAESVMGVGATWTRVNGRVLSVTFRQEREEPVFVEARIRGLDSRAAAVRIDGKDIGTLRFAREQTQVVSTATTTTPLSEGPHVVSLHFHGKKRDKQAAEVDWIRVGIPDDNPTTFAAPTLRDLAMDATIAGRPYRSLALRAPSRVRCAVAVADTMSLRTTLGYAGNGEGEARIELSEPGKPPVLLHSSKLGGEGQASDVLDLPLDGYAGRIVSIDLVATDASPNDRILFGEPVLRVRTPRVSNRPEAKVVVVVVLSGASPSHVPGYDDVRTMPTLSSLLEESVVFHAHRTSTTLVAGSMASLLTGLSPVHHKVADPGARLGERLQTLGSVGRDGRANTGMFTGNPATFEAFGFGQGWTRFASYSPVSGTSAGAPLREATSWVDNLLKKDKQRPLLVVVHARGGHPPWIGTDADFENLPPPEYAGNITARRGGQVLAKERNQRFGSKPMPVEDRIRVDAFARIGLRYDDAQIGQLIETLRQHNVWSSTLLIVTSDIAMGGGHRVPFGDGERLGEDLLTIPLVVRFPDRRFGGSRVYAPTTAMDVARTVLLSMGLAPPDRSEGRDLLAVAAHPGRFEMQPQFAMTGAAYATRWGKWILTGLPPRTPKFCELTPDQDCTQDATAQHPFFASWMWRMTRDHLSPEGIGRSPGREPATLDPETVAALTVWGSLEPEPAPK